MVVTRSFEFYNIPSNCKVLRRKGRALLGRKQSRTFSYLVTELTVIRPRACT